MGVSNYVLGGCEQRAHTGVDTFAYEFVHKWRFTKLRNDDLAKQGLKNAAVMWHPE